MQHTIQALEEELLSSSTRRSAPRLDELLSVDFLEYGASGRIYDKASVLRRLPENEHTVHMETENFQLVLDTPETVLCTYQLVVEGVRHSNRSSLWVNQNGSWVMRFHQGTRIESSEA